MSVIDYERLLIIIKNDVHESEHQNFDLEKIVNDAVISEDGTKIIVKSTQFELGYDINTYVQLYGRGGG